DSHTGVVASEALASATRSASTRASLAAPKSTTRDLLTTLTSRRRDSNAFWLSPAVRAKTSLVEPLPIRNTSTVVSPICPSCTSLKTGESNGRATRQIRPVVLPGSATATSCPFWVATLVSGDAGKSPTGGADAIAAVTDATESTAVETASATRP